MSTKPGTILVVDDDADIRVVVTEHVRRMGVRYLEADSGAAAIEALRSHAVDVVLSDLMMPTTSGLDLLRLMISEGRLQPFIVLTGYPSQDATLQALRLGAFDFVEKPFEADDLGALLTEALRVSQAYQAAATPGDEALHDAPRETSNLKRLRALRHTPGSDAVTGSGIDRFIAETEPQLSFCGAAIKGLVDPNQRSMELGYLFRVYQAMAEAALDAGDSVVADLADAAARLYTLLRVLPRAYDSTLGSIAERTNQIIHQLLTRPMERAASELQARAVEGELRIAVEAVANRSVRPSA